MNKKTAIVIQARLGSTRLPAKVLLPLPTGRSVIQEIVCRMTMLGLESDLVEGVYLAVPDKDVPIFATHFEVSGMGVTIVQGGELNVLSRFVEVEKYLPDSVGSIMRITGDCPLINPDVCLRVLWTFNHDRTYAGRLIDYCSNVSDPEPRHYTRGLDCEVFSRNMLHRIDPGPETIEHVTPDMRDAARFNVVEVRPHMGQTSPKQENYSLDTIEDYRRIYAHFVNHGGMLDG
jgi:spore coat polysaccharide biosynthesis protein SpsF (cytidylyltransferase family)